MAPPEATAIAATETPEDAPSATKIEALGIKVEIPLPKWAVACLAAIIVIGVLVGGIYLSATKLTHSVFIPTSQMEVYEETNFHLTQPSSLRVSKEETFDAVTITVNYFKSDGCVQIVRWDALTAKGDGLWMFGEHPHSVGHVHEAQLTTPRPPTTSAFPSLKSISYLQLTPGEGAQLTPVQGGRCWDPHPGAFTVANTPVNQCVVQVWRTFYDGCVHFQYYNACAGTWDVYPNGAPRVTWTRCVH
jgi:hypothetical protein